MERSIFHQLKHRTQTYILLCVLAYHLLVAIEKRFLDRGIHTSWWSLRQELSTHQVVTLVLPTTDGRVLRIRKGDCPRADPSRDLLDAEDSAGGHEAGEELAGRHPVVTEKNVTP